MSNGEVLLGEFIVCWVPIGEKWFLCLFLQVLGTFITEWAEGASVCRSLLATAESCCMFASRLAELAYELGFDGWLVRKCPLDFPEPLCFRVYYTESLNK